MERIEEPEINRQIVLLFLQKLEVLNDKERGVLIEAIHLITHPFFLAPTRK